MGGTQIVMALTPRVRISWTILWTSLLLAAGGVGSTQLSLLRKNNYLWNSYIQTRQRPLNSNTIESYIIIPDPAAFQKKRDLIIRRYCLLKSTKISNWKKVQHKGRTGER